MRNHVLGVIFTVLCLGAGACSSGTQGSGQSALTFDGNSCAYTGPVSLSLGGAVEFTLANRSSVDMAVVVLELGGASFEDLVDDDVRVFPPTASWPPSGAHPDELKSSWVVDADTEIRRSVVLHNAGGYGAVCWPLDGSPALGGALLTVEG
jgi:hypothetical protein